MNLIKLLLHIFNIGFALGGIAFIGIGIWTAADKIYVSSLIGDTLFSAASYLLIAVGLITLCVCIFGIYAVVKEKKKLILVYFVILILAAVLMLVGGIIAVVFKSEAESAMVDQMRKTLIDGYGSDSDVTDAWDKVQEDMRCCAISLELIGDGSSLYKGPYQDSSYPTLDKEKQAQDSWPIYKRTQWYNKQKDLPASLRKYVPKSCCIRQDGKYLSLPYCQSFNGGPPTNYASGLTNYHLYYDGCYEKTKSMVMDHADILVALGFVFAFVMIAGIVLTFLVLRSLGDENDPAKRRREPDNL